MGYNHREGTTNQFPHFIKFTDILNPSPLKPTPQSELHLTNPLPKENHLVQTISLPLPFGMGSGNAYRIETAAGYSTAFENHTFSLTQVKPSFSARRCMAVFSLLVPSSALSAPAARSSCSPAVITAPPSPMR